MDKSKDKKQEKDQDKQVSAKENYRMTMSETYVEPEHNCGVEKE